MPGEATSNKSKSPKKGKKKEKEQKDSDSEDDEPKDVTVLNYLEKGSRSDIAYIVHQCSRFAAAPKQEHADAIRWLGRYLAGTRDKGTILRPKSELGLEVHVDADFVGNWNKDEWWSASACGLWDGR